MKTSENEKIKILEEGLAQIGIAPGPDAAGRFMLYLEELKKWNRTHNLTAIREDRQIIIKHFLDSALYLKAVDGRGRNLADVGSGAGFPGVVLKLLRPDLTVSLIEPSWKKAAFLRHIIRRLDLSRGMSVFEGRAEEMKPGVPFDIAVTRALWKAPDFVKKTCGIVKKGGWFVMSKGPSYAAELEGMSFEALRLKLPFTDTMRFVIIINNGDENNIYEKDQGKKKRIIRRGLPGFQSGPHDEGLPEP